MTLWLDGIATWLTGIGIHPVLGAFIAGILVGRLVRSHATVGIGATPGAFTSSTVSLEHGAGSVTVNGTTVPLESSVLATVVDAIRGGRMIEAIKTVREKTGLGLAESKHLVDAVARSPLLR